MQAGDTPDFPRVEASYAAYLEAWGAWMVGHHRGAPPERDVELSATLVAARTTLAEQLSGASAGGLSPADRDALNAIRACLPDLDAWAQPLDGRVFEPPSNHRPAGIAEPADLGTLRRATFEAWGAAMANLSVDGHVLDRLTATTRLAQEADGQARRRIFLAMEPAWNAVHPDDGAGSPYRRLLLASVARWAAEGSPIDANAAALGMDPAAVEPTMRAVMAAFRSIAVGPDLVEPWDYRHLVGGLARRLDPLIPVGRLREINDAHLRAIGADPAALRIHYDIHPRPDRPVIPTAFTVTEDVARQGSDGTWTAAIPWVFATYAEGGIGNLEELLHESGHALHYAALRARPAHFSWPPNQTAFVEAVADVVGWSAHEPALLREHLGVEVSARESMVARFGSVILDAAWTLFEVELHRHPDRSPNKVWAEIAERDLGVKGHPEWAWWAGRGQLIDGPGYLANYALGAIMVAAVRARIREQRGDWSSGDPGWYEFVSERLLRFAGARTPRSILLEFLGEPLTAEALLRDIERPG